MHARCRGLPAEVFYTGDGDRGARRVAHEEHAKQICHHCPVLHECLGHAMDADEPYGIWGATTPKERAALRSSQAFIS
ncbi:WhiB family transcriptional regulator [Mycolicibacterium sp. HS_4_1]